MPELSSEDPNVGSEKAQLRKGTQRPSWDEYFLNIADVVSTRSTCVRRAVGCVIVDKNNHIISIGYNGNPPGLVHCLDYPCPEANAPSGTSLEGCFATHAEINALDISKGKTVYLPCTPCTFCARAICGTSIKRIVAREWYPHNDVRTMLAMADIEVSIVSNRETLPVSGGQP